LRTRERSIDSGNSPELTDSRQPQESDGSVYRAILEQAADGFSITDSTGCIVEANPRAAEICGLPLEELIGCNFQSLFDPEELKRNPVDMRRVLVDHEVVRNERTVVHPDGTRVTVEVAVNLLSDGRVFTLVRELTERKQAEIALRESEERHRRISELTSDFSTALVVHADGTLEREWSTAAIESISGFSADEIDPAGRILNLTDAELAARGTRGLIHPDDGPRVQRDLSALGDPPNDTATTEFRIVKRSGESLWARMRVLRVPIPNTDSVRLFAAIQDINYERLIQEEREETARTLERMVESRTQQLEVANRELKKLQTQMVEAATVQTAGELAGDIAHAINNPLTALIGTLQMMLERQPGEKRTERSLRLAVRIQMLVERTLQLVREGALDRSETRAAELFSDIQEELGARAANQEVRLELRAPEDLPELRIDRPLLATALSLVAENALDAMPHGGELTIEAAMAPRVDALEFRISDRGPGVPEAKRAEIFRPFYSTKSSGAGLGLSVARGIISGHEGRVRIEDRPGGGTVFVIEIPRYLSDDRSVRTDTHAKQSKDEKTA